MVGGFETSRTKLVVIFLVAYLSVCIDVTFTRGTAPALGHKDAQAFYNVVPVHVSFQPSALRLHVSAWVDNLYGFVIHGKRVYDQT